MNTQSPTEASILYRHNALGSLSLVEIHRAEPRVRDRSAQELFIIIEIAPRKENERPHAVEAIRRLIQSADDVFIASREQTPERVLEEVIDSLNASLATVFSKRQSLFHSLSMVIGLTEHGQIHFSQIGGIQALLIHGASITDITESQEASSLLKAFTHVTSGLLNPSDTLVFTTNSLTDYVAHDKLRTLANALTPASLADQLAHLVAPAPAQASFAAFIIKFTTEFDSEILYQHEQDTNALRSPREDVPDNDVFLHNENLPSPRARRTEGTVYASLRRIPLGPTLAYFKRGGAHYFYYLWRIAHKSLATLLLILRVAINPRARAHEETKIVALTYTRFHDVRSALKANHRGARVAFYILAATALLLLHTLVFQGLRQAETKKYIAFDELIAAIAADQKEADNAIIYEDEKRAAAILQNTLNQLKRFSPLNDEQAAAIQNYSEEIERQLKKINRITTVEQPVVFADIGSQIENEPLYFTMEGANFVIATDRDVYRLIDTKIVKIGSSADPIAALLPSGPATLFLTRSGSLLRINGDRLESIPFTASPEQKSITAATTYAGNLYILDAQTNAIFKYTGAGLRFGAGSIWLRDPVLLSESVSLSADGALYTLNRSGTLSKLVRGTQQDFALAQTVPAIGDNGTVATSGASARLYILDPAHNRALVFNKEGAIQNQFTSPEFTNLRAFAHDEKEETLFLLAGGKIFALNLK